MTVWYRSLSKAGTLPKECQPIYLRRGPARVAVNPGDGDTEGRGGRAHGGDRVAGGAVEEGAHDAGLAVEGEERHPGDRVVGIDIEEGDTEGVDPTGSLLGFIELDREFQWYRVIADDTAGRAVIDIDLNDLGRGGTDRQGNSGGDGGELLDANDLTGEAIGR